MDWIEALFWVVIAVFATHFSIAGIIYVVAGEEGVKTLYDALLGDSR